MSTFSIRSNATTSRAYNNLSKVQSSLNSNIERLSSGLRINSASDDSAGSSVAVRMVSQINGMKQANANAQQANNLLATAESGLSDISDILGRMRELAVQAGTDTLNDDDRDSIDLEFQALGDEIGRIASATEYDDNALLDGSYGTIANGSLNGVGAVSVNSDVEIGNQFEIEQHGNSHEFIRVKMMDSTGARLADQTLNKSTGSFGNGDVLNFHELGITLTLSSQVNTDGSRVSVTGKSLQIGADNDANHQLSISIGNATESGLGIDSKDVQSVGNARGAIDALDGAIDIVNHERSQIGAVQNRLSFTVSNLSNHTQAIEAGRSAIADVDFAAEATALARNQILAQSGTAMLAQASAVSQNVLGLLI